MLSYLFIHLYLDVKNCAQNVNKNMLELVSSKEDKANVLKYLNLESVLKVLRQYLDLAQSSVETKVAALNWIHHLFTEVRAEVTTIQRHRRNYHIILFKFREFYSADVSACHQFVPRSVEDIIGQFG